MATLTTVIPKPLLPLGDRAVLDVVIRQLEQAGCDEIIIAVGHLAHLVRAVCGDGSAHGIPIRYQEESSPLGTAGPLRDIQGLDETFLMMNGDVLTTLDYGDLLGVHRAAGNIVTIASHRRVVSTDYGVLHIERTDRDAGKVTRYEEKPELHYVVSMGVYALEPEALEYIPAEGPFDLPDLVIALLERGAPVGSFMHDGYWLDIGRPDDYARALSEFDAVLPQLIRGEQSDR